VTRRLLPLGVALALLAALVGAIISACYDIPRPACGFVCGPDGACPDGYTCANDHYCHRSGEPDGVVCHAPDAALPADAAPDVPADTGNDAAGDAAADAADDAAPDGPDVPDAMADAMPDAMDNAMDDAPP
jgi:hypothetical protein